MKEIFKAKSFWFGFLILSVVIFIALINFNRVYKTESQILIIPKSEKAASNSEQIIENFSSIPYTLSFFERIIKNNEDVADESVLEMPEHKKKAYWNSKIKAERISKSGIIRIISSDKDQYQADIINKEIIKEFLATAGIYYDIRKDIDVRIIDSSITEYSNSEPKTILALESLLVGFILVFLSFLIPFSLFKKGEEIRTTLPNIQEKIKNDIARKPIFEEEKAWFNVVKPKPSYNIYNKKASAPDNLPVAEENIIEENIKDEPIKLEEKIQENIERTPITREATPEEVKERLNKLLSGKL